MAWAQETSEWRFQDPTWGSDEVDAHHRAGPWYAHRWFAYDLLCWGRPGTVVTTGIGHGQSLFAFAQAVKDSELDTELFGIADPGGQDHDDGVGQQMLAEVERIHELRFRSIKINILSRASWEAQQHFLDGSIDLLNLGDVPSGDAGRRYVEAWLRKLSPDGLLLIHDVMDPARAPYVDSLIADSAGFVFPFSFGLAVVPQGGTGYWDAVFHPSNAEKLISYYDARSKSYLYRIQLDDHVQMVADRDELLRKQDEVIADRDRSISFLTEKSAAQDVVLRASQLPGEAEIDQIAAMRIQQLNSLAANQSAQLIQFDKSVAELRDKNAKLRARVRGLQRYKTSTTLALKVVMKQGPRAVARRARVSLGRTRRVLRRSSPVAQSPASKATGVTSSQPKQTRFAIPKLSDSQLSRLQSKFDPDYYVRARGLSSNIDAWSDYLNHGIANGVPPSAAVEQASRVVPALGAASGSWDSPPVNAGLLYTAAESVTAVPLPAKDVSQFGPYVSYDLWDTLIERTRPADSGKLSTARRMKLRFPMSSGLARRTEWDLMRERVAVEAEIARSRPSQEYRATEVLALIVARYCPDVNSEVAARQLVDEEVEEEIRYSRARVELPGPPPLGAVILSDFYFDSTDLGKIVAAVRPEWADVPIFSSCEVSSSKRLAGGLFDLVRRERAIPVDQHVHVGDNMHSDVNMQLESGGRALLLPVRPSRYPGPGSLSADFGAQVLRDWPDYVASQLPAPATAARASGRRWAMFPASLVVGAVETAVASSARSVFYLSREGLFLQQVHHEVARANRLFSDVEGRHLAVSRRSTFGPSLSALSKGELMRLWSMYGSQSIRGLLLSLGVDDDLPGDVLRRNGLDFDESLSDIAGDSRVRNLLSDSDFTDFVWWRLQEQRALLSQYLRQSFAREAGQIVVSDVGWRGTIQDNITKVVGRPTIGVYLGLFKFLNPQSPVTTKLAVAFDGNRKHPFANYAPPAAIERPWTPNQGSTIRYARGAKPGEVVPVLEESESHVDDAIAEFQAGVLDAAPVFAAWLEGLGLMGQSLSVGLREQLDGYFSDPDPVIADIWFGSDHDDTFGSVGHDHVYAKPRPDQTWFSDADAAAQAFKASGWPAGFAAWKPVRTLLAGIGDK